MQIYLAPMEGITTFVYRNAFAHKGLVVVPQILTNQAEVFLAIAKQLADYGYREVNLNLGCPSGTVVAKKRGAGFLCIPDVLDAFLEEIFEKCPLKISIKTRIGIETFLSKMQEFPILCYNGDIVSKASLDAVTNKLAPLDTIMLGRGTLANPKLPLSLKNEKTESRPTVEELKTFRAFHDEILEGYTSLMSGDQPVLFRMKELWTYMRAYPALTDKQMKQIRKTKKLEEYRSVIAGIMP